MFLKLPDIIIYYKSVFRCYKTILKENHKNKCSYKHTLKDCLKLRKVTKCFRILIHMPSKTPWRFPD